MKLLSLSEAVPPWTDSPVTDDLCTTFKTIARCEQSAVCSLGVCGQCKSLRSSVVCISVSSRGLFSFFVNRRFSRRGRLSKEKSTKTPKMNCRNWECGVIVPVPAMRGRQSENEGRSSDEEDWGKRKEIVVPSPTFEVFEGVVPVPMVVPGEPFGDRRPWFYNP